MTKCYACNKRLTADASNTDTEYQFDGALWVTFYGGYGMFVDNLNAKLPTNTEDRWLRDSTGEYLTDAEGQPVENLAYTPKYHEPRMIDPPPDYEAVICHDCAHQLCATIPWIERLINSHNSHSHTTAYHDAHPEHYGWDYDPDPS